MARFGKKAIFGSHVLDRAKSQFGMSMKTYYVGKKHIPEIQNDQDKNKNKNELSPGNCIFILIEQCT